MTRYHDRNEAGIILAEHLIQYNRQPDVIVLALPRGGVPIAYEVAKALSVPLDVFIVRKLGAPGHKELAIGAIASGGTIIYNEEILSHLHPKQTAIDDVLQSEQEELNRREHLYRGDKLFPSITGKIIILIDDGIATGATMKAAIEALKKHHPKEIVIAVPVAALSTCQELSPLVSKLICPLKPIEFYAVGLWYETFPQTSDEEVIKLLEQAQQMSRK